MALIWGIRAGVVVMAFTAGWVVNGWRHDAATLAAEERVDEIEAQLDRVEAERLVEIENAAALARELEDMARADPNNDGGLSRSRVERLLRR